MKSIRIYWLLICIFTFSLYLFDITVAMAAPKSDEPGKEFSVSQNTTQDSSGDIVTDMTFPPDESAHPQPKPQEDAVPDTVSTAEEFKEWLEAHKNGGGSVRLTDNIVLKEFYYFSPSGANRPDIIVDTDTYTITAAGTIIFLSDGHLIFRGKAGSRGIFRAARGSMLTLDGVIVEGTVQGTSPQYTLWQEEGAGLFLGNTYTVCKVSGEIHYADTPFVIKSSPACVVVEKEQSAKKLLPSQICCNVNYQGQIQYDKLMPVSWKLDGTETQQEKRRRFFVEGFSDQAVYQVPPICTVVYNDYPLTFTDVRVSIKSNTYYFEGGYTKPKIDLPITVISEYSFDDKNWIIYDENEVTNVNAGFRIYFACKEWDTVHYPYIYIRLRGEKDGKTYVSNVLRCRADNMNEVEDLGGGRGGGTSIVNPPEKPKDDIEAALPEDSGLSGSQNLNDHNSSQGSQEQGTEPGEHKSKGRENEAHGTDIVSDTDIPENDSESTGQDSTDDDLPINSQVSSSPGSEPVSKTAVPENTDDKNTAHISMEPAENVSESKDTKHYAMADAEDSDSHLGETSSDSTSEVNLDVMSEETAGPNYEEEDAGERQQVLVKQRLNKSRNIVLISGFITLSAGAGVVGYFVHTSRLRRYKRGKTSSKRGHRRKDKNNKR